MANTKFDFNDVYSSLAEGGVQNNPPSKEDVVCILRYIQHLMFPAYFKGDPICESYVSELYEKIKHNIETAYAFADIEGLDCEAMAMEIVCAIPKIKDTLKKDVVAIYDGDPAAVCPEEVILSYPGFFAISVYRIAHEFYMRKIPFISRIMTEYAHEKTGIDIHAGATIGEYFFIDHGTGIVIGETTTIGDHVKIYQGVTLGAKSFELDENGNPVKGTKRHPDIGNNVVIYANATILGGSTKIGDGAVIGGNVWLTRSVDPGSVIYYDKKN